MDDNPTLYLKEATKGCVRIGLFEFLTASNDLRYGVEVIAWNKWVGRGKTLACVAGIACEAAEFLFSGIVRDVRDFDWLSDEVVLEETAA